MDESGTTQTDFIDRVLTSRIPGEVAKRFAFADGEVGALYTLGRDARTGHPCPVVLYVATFPPLLRSGFHDFGIDYLEQPVATPAEARQLLAQFGPVEARQFRASCRPH